MTHLEQEIRDIQSGVRRATTSLEIAEQMLSKEPDSAAWQESVSFWQTCLEFWTEKQAQLQPLQEATPCE
jgi:hypothetical protein